MSTFQHCISIDIKNEADKLLLEKIAQKYRDRLYAWGKYMTPKVYIHWNNCFKNDKCCDCCLKFVEELQENFICCEVYCPIWDFS